MKYSKPNFLIVGAAKSGTTSLARYLDQHPEIFIPQKKELRFFVADAMRNISKKDPLRKQILKKSVLFEKEYFKIFEDHNEKRCGEASVHYLYHYEEAIPKIKKWLGDIPIIIILRNPVDRAISNWNYNGKDLHPFRQSFRMEGRRKDYNAFWYYQSLGMYYEQVKSYLENFSNVKLIIFEDFVKETNKKTNEVFEFLGLNSDYPIDTNIIHNKQEKYVPVTTVLKFLHNYEFLYKIIMSLKSKGILADKWFINKWQLFNKKEDKRYALSFFRKDIEKLEELLNKDLSNWKILHD